MIKINTDHLKELAETMDLIAQHQLDKASQIYYCVVESVNNNQCTIVFNNKQYTVPYYGGKPTPNKTYAIFLPHNNMNESFVIGDGKDGGGSGSGIAIQDDEPTDGELVWIDTDDPGTTHIIPEIDDTQESAVDTWSSQKIASEIANANDSGTNYCKMPDGTMICWGRDSIPANKDKVTITFPFSFVDTTYQIVFSAVFMSTSDVTLVGGAKAVSTCDIYRKNTTASEQPVNWQAIGRWK